MESLDEFDKHVPPPPSFSDIQEIIHAWERMQPPENYTATEAMMAENEWKRRVALWRQIKSHLLQSQIKVIEAVEMELRKSVLKLAKHKECHEGNCEPCENCMSVLVLSDFVSDQISSLNETLEFLKKSL